MSTTTYAYDSWNAIRTRTSSTGISMMPLSGPPPMPSVPIVLDGGSEFDIVVFSASRWNKAPIIPSPIMTDSNRVLLGGSQTASFPIPYTADIKLYEISGFYVWAILNPEGLLSDMPTGTPPLSGDGSDSPLSFGEYLQMAGILNPQLITTPRDQKMATGDNSQFEDLPQLFRVITGQKW